MRIALSSTAVALAAVTLSLFACSTNTVVHQSSGATDTLEGTDIDSGPPSHADAGSPMPPTPTDPAPAMTPTFPQVSLHGGSVIAAPKFQLVRYASDENTAPVGALLKTMGASSYWRNTTSEYGVGPSTALGDVVVSTAPPDKIDDKDIKTWLASQLDTQNAVGLAPADGSTAYVLAFPATTTITEKGDASCVQFGGYHDAVTRANGQVVPYIVLPYCVSGSGAVHDSQTYTMALSHEMVELVTDPQPFTGYRLADEHKAWMYYAGWETGDLCAFLRDALVQPDDLGGAYVQRTWSNSAAALGHEPCVPAAAAGVVAFGAFADARDVIHGWNTIKVPDAGRTIRVRLYADAPMGSFKVTAVDRKAMFGGKPELKGTFANGSDTITGKAGDLVDLTITPLKPGTLEDGTSLLFLDAFSDDGEHLWPLLIAH